MDYSELFGSHFDKKSLLFNEPMANHTSFKIGGPADAIIFPETARELLQAISICTDNHVNYLIIGNGSNLLCLDNGFRGVIICLVKFSRASLLSETVISATAGITLAKLSGFALEHGLTGLEFASGIPGTLGGGISMNAGAYDGEMKQVVQSVEVVDNKGNMSTLPLNEMKFGYRTSIVQDSSYTVLGASIKLSKGNPSEIADKMKSLNAMRKDKQPLEFPSAGSTFRRPEGYFAAKLIDDANLRGYSIGGAKVSDKHCGFVVNYDNATAEDVLALINHIKSVIKQKFGVEMVPEIKIIGD